MKMNEKLKWIFLYGGLGWGISFTLIVSLIRDVQDKPVAFGSFPLFFTISIFGGLFVGMMMFNYVKNEPSDKQIINLEKLSKGLLVWGILLIFYGFVIKFIFVPLDYQNTIGAYIFKWFLLGIGFYQTNKIREDIKEI